MTINDLLQTFSPEEVLSIMSYDNKADEIGEEQYYFGSARDLACNEKKLADFGEKKVSAITMGMASLIIAI